MSKPIERALLSVSDKRGLESFARVLGQQGVELLATGGTKRLLQEAGLDVREVADVTGFPEMMDGRVKTLHPRVHGGILALRDESTHVDAMREHAIPPIDLVVVNLYPFEETVSGSGVTRRDAIENIDIGGPSMVRSAAKNHDFVTVVTSPDDYGAVLDDMQANGGSVSEDLRRRLARKAFARTASYDAAISEWLFEADADEGDFPEQVVVAGTKAMDLRYGENPHQRAAFYRSGDQTDASVGSAKLLGGKALSYNNIVDLDSALALAKEFQRPFVCVVKHNNPCGAACSERIEEALSDAWSGDPLSAFGSVLAFNRPFDRACVDFLVSENRFVEAMIAPAFEADALELLHERAKWGKNVRLLACGPIQAAPDGMELKRVAGGFLVQTSDRSEERSETLEVVTKQRPSADQIEALLFANSVCKHVRSNAIVIATDQRVLGVGAGQMSRVDSVKLAVEKAGDEVAGSVLASDAFFPFPDGVEMAMDAGVAAILQPGGSIRDKKIVEVCEQRGVPMVLSGVRHFRH